MTDLTTMEWEILEEVAGIRPARGWGAAVGACLEALYGYGLVTKTWRITEAGRAALNIQKLLRDSEDHRPSLSP